MLLSNQRVIDELFPLNSCKIIGQEPRIEVIFQKKMNTLDYILGDPQEKLDQLKDQEVKEKKELQNKQQLRKKEE